MMNYSKHYFSIRAADSDITAVVLSILYFCHPASFATIKEIPFSCQCSRFCLQIYYCFIALTLYCLRKVESMNGLLKLELERIRLTYRSEKNTQFLFDYLLCSSYSLYGR